eukprot:COSAG01_NODE_9032_length_2576_cov_6.898668_3_plen_43_part_00
MQEALDALARKGSALVSVICHLLSAVGLLGHSGCSPLGTATQ